MNKLFKLSSCLLITSLLFCIILKINVTNDFQNQSIFLSINFLFTIIWSILYNYIIYKNILLITLFYITSFIILLVTEYIDSVLKLNIIYGAFEHCQEIKNFGTIYGVPILVIIGDIPLHYLTLVITEYLLLDKKNVFKMCFLNSIIFSIFDVIIESVTVNSYLYEFKYKHNQIFNIPFHNIIGRIIVDMLIFIIYRYIEEKILIKENKYNYIKINTDIKIYTLLIFFMFNIWYMIQIKYILLKIIVLIYLLIILIYFIRVSFFKTNNL
jgi:hypothetical protein